MTVQSRHFAPGLLAALILLFCASAAMAAGAWRENQVKAAFLHHFAQFTEWPPGALGAEDEPFLLCILGKHPSDEDLAPLEGRRIQGHPLEVRRIHRIEEGLDCQLLYIEACDRHLQDLSPLQGRAVLTVSNEKGFAARGGMIGLVAVDGKFKFEINRSAVGRSGLSLSAQLLDLATLVGSDNQGEEP